MWGTRSHKEPLTMRRLQRKARHGGDGRESGCRGTESAEEIGQGTEVARRCWDQGRLHGCEPIQSHGIQKTPTLAKSSAVKS